MTETNPTHEEMHHPSGHWYDCTGFQRDLLLGIATHDRLDQAPCGANLHRWLEGRYPHDVNRSRVYTNLGDLYDAGMVKRRPINDRKTAYELTEAGQECLAAHGRLVEELDLPDMMPATARDQ
ncbi:MarR family winged helix-turn-helix transcriptional regulator [Haloarcula salinisoli]|uniref:MarR family winged helix-turn-helix transcriptional regulator n=1 Tax=Haloarcula salinisoli TaxID=2487746 RepID=A0A8J7YHT5_9EURY|nr:MarR family winged helix-turn-helix transcriptional regulator [Halomicroarcula salinisoli]MBX0305797.1 MarR family winged helix-turn-helix transcriptional regulator [Halomicroarcula salinisoli]